MCLLLSQVTYAMNKSHRHHGYDGKYYESYSPILQRDVGTGAHLQQPDYAE